MTLWSDLVVSMLAVNNYGLDRAYGLTPALEEVGLTDLGALSQADEPTIARMLGSAGYERGSFMTKLFSERLSKMAKHVQEIGQDEFAARIGDASSAGSDAALLAVPGIGPTVVKNFRLLRAATPE